MPASAETSAGTAAVRPFTAHGGSAAHAFDVVIPSMHYSFYPDTGHN